MSYAHPYNIHPDNSMEPIPTICIQAKYIIAGHAADNYKSLIGFTMNDFTANSTADCGNDNSFDNYFNSAFRIPKRPSWQKSKHLENQFALRLALNRKSV
jgi:hypothetical protein